MAVTLYRQVGKGRNRRYKKVNLGPGRRPVDLAGPYFLRYSLLDRTRPWEPVDNDLDAAIEAQKRKQEYFRALRANVPVLQDQQDPARLKITDTVYAENKGLLGAECGRNRTFKVRVRSGGWGVTVMTPRSWKRFP
jgi:hypothetical protein